MLIIGNMQQSERYGGSAEGKLEGVSLENDTCSSPSVLPIYKRRKVSAARDFPPGSELSVDMLSTEFVNVELVETELPMASYNDGIVDPLKMSEHESFEMSKNLRKVDIASPAEDIAKPSSSRLALAPNMPATNASVSEKTVTQKYPSRGRISAVRDFPLFCGRNVSRLTKEVCLKAVTSSNCEILGQVNSHGKGKPSKETIRTSVNQIGEDVQDNDISMSKSEAVISEYTEDKVQAEIQWNDTKESRKQVQSEMLIVVRDGRGEIYLEEKVEKNVVCNGEVGGFEEKIGKVIGGFEEKMEKDNGGVKEKVGKDNVFCSKEIGGLDGNEGEEIVVFNADDGVLGGMRKTKYQNFPGLSGSENQYQTEDVDFECAEKWVMVQGLKAAPNCPWVKSAEKRAIVQGLMAAPNSLWMQGKKASKPNPTGGMQGRKGKKHNLSVQEKSTYSLRPKQAGAKYLGKRKKHDLSTQEKPTYSLRPKKADAKYPGKGKKHDLSTQEKPTYSLRPKKAGTKNLGNGKKHDLSTQEKPTYSLRPKKADTENLGNGKKHDLSTQEKPTYSLRPKKADTENLGKGKKHDFSTPEKPTYSLRPEKADTKYLGKRKKYVFSSPEKSKYSLRPKKADAKHLGGESVKPPSTTKADAKHLGGESVKSPSTTKADAKHLGGESVKPPSTTKADAKHLGGEYVKPPSTAKADAKHLGGESVKPPSTAKADAKHLGGESVKPPSTAKADAKHLGGESVKPPSTAKADAKYVGDESVKPPSMAKADAKYVGDESVKPLSTAKADLKHLGGESVKSHSMAKAAFDFKVNLPPLSPPSSSRKSGDHDAVVTRNKVRETLRLFQAVCRKLLQEEEANSKAGENTAPNRIYLQAAKIFKDKNMYVNAGKQILGPVPGVEVGDEFHYRVELAIIGIHRALQGGIDCVNQHGKVLATSIVASGFYANNLDSSDVLIYMGSGGMAMGRDKQPEDQKLQRGNLALKNSIEEKNPVRVIRGFKMKDKLSERSKTYIYDGLYLVEKYWPIVGPHGKQVFKFQLRRIAGQPELAWNVVKNSKKFKREGLCVDDISEGKELIAIGAVNTIDDEKPPSFKYTTSMIYPNYYCPIPLIGCDCTTGCLDCEKCSCAVRNGGELPYNYDGAIVEAKSLVYECGPSCKCPPTCHNRVSQHGIKFQLEIFKTESRGWGLRSLNSISSGSFICEYFGELLDDKEAEERTGNDEYLFDIGQNYNDHVLWDGLSNLLPDAQSSYCQVVEDVGFTIDAAQYGNVGRFINHSCSPNLYAQNVLYDQEDKRIPHIMFFAAENIPPLQELTYHYNYQIDEVYNSDGNIKKKNCYCGSSECTGRMY